MPITVATPDVGAIEEVVEAVASWQREGGSVPLHPGDLGWNASRGPDHFVRTLRVWRDGPIRAVGLLEDGALIRMAVAPAVDEDERFATRLLADVAERVSVEARSGAAFRRLLTRSGWLPGEPWTPLRRDLAGPVPVPGLRIEVVGEDRAAERVAVHRAAFERSTFSLERWRAVAASPAYRRARCLLGYDADDVAVAAVTVWSAGEGRPGLLEPMGVHRDHRGHGYGTAISVAAAAALREMGATSATVCTPTSNVGGVATYVAAGFASLGEVTDFVRPAPSSPPPS